MLANFADSITHLDCFTLFIPVTVDRSSSKMLQRAMKCTCICYYPTSTAVALGVSGPKEAASLPLLSAESLKKENAKDLSTFYVIRTSVTT